MSAMNSVNAELIEDDGESRYKIIDVIGEWQDVSHCREGRGRGGILWMLGPHGIVLTMAVLLKHLSYDYILSKLFVKWCQLFPGICPVTMTFVQAFGDGDSCGNVHKTRFTE